MFQPLLITTLILSTPLHGDSKSPQIRRLSSRPMDAICPSYCECLREETNDGASAYSVECHMGTNTLPIACAQRWVNLKLNLYNYTGPLQPRSFHTKPVFSYCHELVSLYIRQTGENPVGLALRSLLQGLMNLRRVWFHHVHLESDGVEASNFYKIPPKLELIAFSDCSVTLDANKPLFFDTPTSLQQLRLTNVSLTGSLSSRLLVNLCHTSKNAFRPNDIVSLYLDRNHLKSLDRNSLLGCRNLRVLQLSYNHLAGSLEEVMGLSSQILRQNWAIKKTLAAAETLEYGVLGHTPQLEALDLSGNFITGIRSPLWAYGREGTKIHSLTELKTISLSNNNLTYIVRGAFQGAPNLREIDLSRNPRLFCPMHLETPAFYSYIDPYIFGGIQKLTKVYWDFADKTCILSSMMSESSYGVLSEGLFKLFASRSLCLSEVLQKPSVINERITHSSTTTSVTDTDQKKLPAVGQSVEKSRTSSLWAPIDMVSSFLCGLIAPLLIVLFVVLAVRSKTLFEVVVNCCDRGKGCPILSRTENHPPGEPPGPRNSPCYTLPSNGRRPGLLLLCDEEAERLNNGLTSSSLQNLCLACLDQPTTSSAAAMQAQSLEFYDNCKHLTTSFLGGGKESAHQQVRRTTGTEITRVLAGSQERSLNGKMNVNDWNFI
ncbi:Leucine-rich repeat-containing protein 53 [Echinococcus granulosus]|uniref:Leucine rich repeat neuronal protein n=1 Tax=Echinococcus granulosus TaxID=6210 RepID=U6IYP4_ECHGR|nr:Leucine-rich repeat-containing protein 53 [Echinococcus granulosus]EUB63056.1 Leucine-rich repeat-containing protein 53 [Echinococcus granulosus]CDS16919.1 leucine rich repeat neuronal protein [Echinococcus granulosus]